MSNLYLLIETFTNGFYYHLLSIISFTSVLCGISVIISKNPIVSVLFLIALFLNIAVYLMMLGINFIGLSYLLVYVGAVSILFLFILMLINVRISELVTDTSNSIPLAIMTGIFFSMTLYKSFPLNFDEKQSAATDYLSESVFYATDNSYINYSVRNIFSSDRNDDLCLVTSNLWDGMLSESSHITSVGNTIYTSYPLWLIITSIILLLAMVGAIVITIKQEDK